MAVSGVPGSRPGWGGAGVLVGEEAHRSSRERLSVRTAPLERAGCRAGAWQSQ